MTRKKICSSLKGNVIVFACDDYHPYWINGQKNPKFTPACGNILSTKNPENRDFNSAVRSFIPKVSNLISQLNLPPPGRMGPQVSIACVPSSKAGKSSEGLRLIMDGVCKKNKSIHAAPNLLRRTKSIDKLARGGSRDISIHLDSIEYNIESLRTNVVLLFDDVCTTGNSIVACSRLIQRHSPGTVVYGVVLGLTTHE